MREELPNNLTGNLINCLPGVLPTREFLSATADGISSFGGISPLLHHLFSELNRCPIHRWEIYLAGEKYPPDQDAQRFMALTMDVIIKHVYGERTNPWVSS